MVGFDKQSDNKQSDNKQSDNKQSDNQSLETYVNKVQRNKRNIIGEVIRQ
jgi:hypothetical protein